MSEIAIEIDHPRNSNVLFIPCESGREVRSRWVPYRFGAGIPAHKMMLPDIPGETIHLDLKARRGTIKAAMLDENCRSAREKYIQAYRQGTNPQQAHFDNLKPEQTWNLSELQSLQWQYWMRRFVDNGHARIIAGTLPSYKECKAALKGDVPGPNLGGGTNDVWRTVEEVHERRQKQLQVTPA